MTTLPPQATHNSPHRRARWGIEWWIAAAALLFAIGVVARMAQPKLFHERPFTGHWTCVDDPKTTFEIDGHGTYGVVTTGGDSCGIWTERKPARNTHQGTLLFREDGDCILPCYEPPDPVNWFLSADGSILTLRSGRTVWLRGRREPFTSP
jgi:hypothetical protein